MSERSVLLPQPEGPMMATNSQGPMSRVTLRSAATCISSRPPNSRETASRRRPTAWPSRSWNSSWSGGGAGALMAGTGSTSTATGVVWPLWPFSALDAAAAAATSRRARRRRRLGPLDSPGSVTAVATPPPFSRSLSAGDLSLCALLNSYRPAFVTCLSIQLKYAEDQAADHIRSPVHVEIQAIERHHDDDQDRAPDREPADSL